MAKLDLVKSDPQIKARLQSELQPYNLTAKEMSARTGIAVGTLNNITTVNREGAVRAEYLKAVLEAFPAVDMQYVLTGKRAEHNQNLTDDIRTAYEANGRALEQLTGKRS